MDLADLTRDLETLRSEALDAIEVAPDVAALQALEVEILGKKGRLTLVARGIGALPAEDRPKVGAVANPVREAIEAALARRTEVVRKAALEERLAHETVDVTTPGGPSDAERSIRSSRPPARSPRSSASSDSSSTRGPRSRTT